MNNQPHHHHQYGSVLVGRAMVGAACLLVLGANALVFKNAANPNHPNQLLETITLVSLLWIFAGAWFLCARKMWGRVLVLTILYMGCLGFFLTGIISASADETGQGGWFSSSIIAAVIYLFVSLVLTHSKHVQRLTSRMWE